MAGGTTQGMLLDLQALHACGADCGGPQADAWLAYRPPRRVKSQGTIFDRVRAAYARLGRRVRPEDLTAPAPVVPVPSRARVAVVPTLPPGPAPLPVAPRMRRVEPAPAPASTVCPPVPAATSVAARRAVGVSAARAGRSRHPLPPVDRTAKTTRSRRARAARTRTRQEARRLAARALVRLLSGGR